MPISIANFEFFPVRLPGGYIRPLVALWARWAAVILYARFRLSVHLRAAVSEVNDIFVFLSTGGSVHARREEVSLKAVARLELEVGTPYLVSVDAITGAVNVARHVLRI